MICALLLGREGSSGFPGKNIYPVLGRPLAVYPMAVAVSCPSVARLYVSTDSPKLKELGLAVGAEIIDRPAHLASKQALGEHAYVHGYQVIRERLAKEGHDLELLVLLFANAATVTPQIIEEGIAALRANPAVDSAVTVSSYNMWSPLRARKINAQGLLDPFVPFETFGDPKTMNCDRDSQGDVWFADMGVSIVRPRCLDHLETGLLPQKWMGQKIHPLKQWGGLDVDEPWQMPIVEAWLQAHEIHKLFSVQRTRWGQFYDSERSVLSALQLDPHCRVLDIGRDPGGLGLALRERFGVRMYTAVCPEDQQGEVKVIYPEANVLTEPALDDLTDDDHYDVVAALGTDDEPDFFGARFRRAFATLSPGGSLVFTMRLTAEATLADPAVSYQTTSARKELRKKQPYIVRNIREVVEQLKLVGAGRISAHGYAGTPSSTATTPVRTIYFGTFAVTRRGGEASAQEPQVDLHLPPQILKAL